MGNSLLVFVNEGDDNNLSVENQFNEVCDPLEAGIRAGIPDIKPRSEIMCSPISGSEWTMTANGPVQRSASFDFIRRVRSNQITKFIEHRFLLH